MDHEARTNAIVTQACRLMLRPIARLLIRSGVPFRDFVELAKEAFVEVAGQDHGIRGRETNSARVAILTGLSRKEVGRIRKSTRERTEDRDAGHVMPAARVLAGWHHDPEFCDAQGNPLPLVDEEAPDTPSLSGLIKRFGGDLPPRALIGELQQVGAISRDEAGCWRALKRYYMPAQLDPTAIARSGTVFEDLGNTLTHNLFRKPGAVSRFEGRATVDAVPGKDLEAFYKFVEERAGALLLETDDWLVSHEREDSAAGRNASTRLGLGIYLIQDD